MPINKNHEFEELDGVKCAIVEKNASASRVEFLKQLLEFNRYTVVVTTAAPKTATPPATPSAESSEQQVQEPPSSFTVGVTDVMFNPVNAIFGRLLRTADGRVVTLAYWYQKESVASDDVPYFKNNPE